MKNSGVGLALTTSGALFLHGLAIEMVVGSAGHDTFVENAATIDHLVNGAG